MSLLSSFTAIDKELLRQAPFWIYYLACNEPDNKAPKDEIAFKDYLSDFTIQLPKNKAYTHQRAELEITLALFESFCANFNFIHKNMGKFSNDYYGHLTKIGELSDALLNRHEAQLFKQILVDLTLSMLKKPSILKLFNKSIEENEAIVKLKESLKYRESFTIK